MNKHCLPRQSEAGFTLFELLVVIIIIGILSAIAVPSFTALINRQRLNNAQERVLLSMRTAQANAKRERRTWETCFRDNGTRVSISVQAVPITNTNSSCSNATNWQTLLSENNRTIAIISDITYSTLDQSQAGYYRAQFEYNGGVNPPLHKITLIMRNEPNGIKRCVYVSTILGALRTDRDSNCTNNEE